jgi:hypothetical protein
MNVVKVLVIVLGISDSVVGETTPPNLSVGLEILLGPI